MPIQEEAKNRLFWVLGNAKRLKWDDASHICNEFYLSLERVLENDELGSDKEFILLWTHSRNSEGYSHQFTNFHDACKSPFSTWNTVGELHDLLHNEI